MHFIFCVFADLKNKLVQKDGCMERKKYGRTNGQIDGRMEGRSDGQTLFLRRWDVPVNDAPKSA